MINYDRMFIKNLSEDLNSLYVLTAKDVKFSWGKEETAIFENVKIKWKNDLHLIIPNLEKPFTLETDASNLGLRTVLRQDGKPVSYISRIFTKSERSYGITEKKTLAAL
ncbi:Retrovirus-related Pol polyprotein from transposon 17.6 [Dictyocoela muelleri]|nr:Retrovirus-related Pol polyprotein from transposon 17.6 [Dictyocoela muelleri]